MMKLVPKTPHNGETDSKGFRFDMKILLVVIERSFVVLPGDIQCSLSTLKKRLCTFLIFLPKILNPV